MNEALIVGSQKDYCYVIKEFLELRNLSVTVVLDYKEGIDKLLDEKPVLSVIEIIDREISPALIANIRNSNEFSILDFTTNSKTIGEGNQVLILEDTSSIDTLFDYLKSYLPEVTSARNHADFQDEGSLEYVFYPSLLIDIHRKERTGILSISSDADLKIYFRNGSPVYAEGGDRETMIGRILLNSGRITPEIQREVLEKARERKNRFGEVLIDMELIYPHGLNSYLELQTEEKILRGFCYLSGEYSFSNEARFPDSIVEYEIKLPKVLNEAVKRFIYAEEIEERNPKIKTQGKRESDINRMELKPRELRTVQLLKNNMSIKEVLDTTRLEKYETLKLLYLLGLFKVIELPGVSLDSLGRKSVQRYKSEKVILAADSETRHTTKDREELIELGGYEWGEEVTDGSAPGTAQTDTALPGALQESDSGLSTDAPAYESIDTEKNPFSEEIILYSHGTDTGAGDAGEVEMLIDAENEGLNALEPGGDGAPGGWEIDPGEFSEGGRSEHGGQGKDPDLFSEGSDRASTGLKTHTISLKEMPREIPIDDRDLFSTFEDTDAAVGVAALEIDTHNGVKIEGAPDTDGEYINIEPENADNSDSAFNEKIVGFHAALADKNYYQILGVAEDTDAGDIRDAYYELVKDYHPDVNQQTSGGIREKAQEIFTTINSAYETLSDTEKREIYDSQAELSVLRIQAKSVYEAEIEFKQGQALLTQRDYFEAKIKLGEALKMNPEEPAYIGAYAWASFLVSEDKDGIVEDSIEDLRKAIDSNPGIAENYYYLGSIYKSKDDINKAEQNYEKAIETDPNYIEAKRELRLFNTRKRKNTKNSTDSRTEKRFWSSLFRK